MKTIIAPTDFSDSSLNAVNYAADMAVDMKASLLLLHVVELPATTIGEFPVTEVNIHNISRAEELEKLKNSLLERTNHSIDIESSEVLGSVTYELKQTTELVKPFAVVMSTHAPGAFERMFFGSATLYSAHHLHAPVINVPQGVVYKPIKKIAFACDFKDIYHIPVDEIKNIGSAFNASLHLFYVSNDEESLAAIETEKAMLLNRLSEFEPTFTSINSNSVEKGVELFARQNNVDMVLLVPRKHGWFEKRESSQVIFHLPLPAITIHEE